MPKPPLSGTPSADGSNETTLPLTAAAAKIAGTVFPPGRGEHDEASSVYSPGYPRPTQGAGPERKGSIR